MQYNIGRLQAGSIHIGDITQAAPREVTFPISNLPPANPHFIGRIPQLQTLEQTIKGPTTITQTIAGLAGLLQDMGDRERARPYFEQALAILEVTLGAEHPTTEKVMKLVTEL